MRNSPPTPPEQRRERGPDGSLIIREGMPDRWHYTVAVEDDPKRNVFRGRITVMFDGALKCHLLQSSLSTDEEVAVEVARKKVLAWIDDYHDRHGPGDPPITPPQPVNP